MDEINKALITLEMGYLNGQVSRDVIEKARKAATVGEIREWKGKRYKKQPNGKWLEVSEHGMTKKEHQRRMVELSNVHGSKGHQKHVQAAKELSDKEYDESEIGGEKI